MPLPPHEMPIVAGDKKRHVKHGLGGPLASALLALTIEVTSVINVLCGRREEGVCL